MCARISESWPKLFIIASARASTAGIVVSVSMCVEGMCGRHFAPGDRAGTRALTTRLELLTAVSAPPSGAHPERPVVGPRQWTDGHRPKVGRGTDGAIQPTDDSPVRTRTDGGELDGTLVSPRRATDGTEYA